MLLLWSDAMFLKHCAAGDAWCDLEKIILKNVLVVKIDLCIQTTFHNERV